MKQKFIILTLLLGMISLSSCNKDNGVYDPNVPDKVQEEFQARFPEVQNVEWDMIHNYHVARFNAPKTRGTETKYDSSAWFTENGQFCQTDEDIDFENLPIAVQNAFNAYRETMYPDWEIDDCELLIREGMAAIFVIEIEKGDLEREISISESGDILKDVLDDDDEDEILPIQIPEEIYIALQSIFPETYSAIVILELEIDDDEIEIDIIESGRHKEIELDAQFRLISIEYKVTIEEARALMADGLFQKLADLLEKAGIDLWDEELQQYVEIEVKETVEGIEFEIEIEFGNIEFEIEIDADGDIEIND